MSAFQKYWNNLKENNPEAYEERLKINRERIRKMRKGIYSDPEKHEAYKKRMREKYRQKVSAKILTKTSKRQTAPEGTQGPSEE